MSEEIKRTPLREHFKNDDKLFDESFSFGKYYVLVDILKHRNALSHETWKMERVVRRKDKLRIKPKETRYMARDLEKEADRLLKLGDLIYFSTGDHVIDLNLNKRRELWEFVGSVIDHKKRDLITVEEAKKIMARYPKVT